MIIIQTFQTPFSSLDTSLGNLDYSLTYRYNTRDDLFRLDIADANETEIINGLVLSENYVGLLRPYYLPEFDHGDLFVVKVNASAKPLSLTNLGIGQDYELIYLTNEEIDTYEEEGILNIP